MLVCFSSTSQSEGPGVERTKAKLNTSVRGDAAGPLMNSFEHKDASLF